jgi:hypothetical protein
LDLQVGIGGLSLLGGSKGSSREGEDGEGLVLHFGCDCGLTGDVSLCFRKDVQIGWLDGWNECDETKCTRVGLINDAHNKKARSFQHYQFPPILTCNHTTKKDPVASCLDQHSHRWPCLFWKHQRHHHFCLCHRITLMTTWHYWWEPGDKQPEPGLGRGRACWGGAFLEFYGKTRCLSPSGLDSSLSRGSAQRRRTCRYC